MFKCGEFKMVFITDFIQLTVIVIFLGVTTATSVQVVGRNKSSSECDKYNLIPGDNTFNLSSDEHQIDPPCSLYYLGFGKADKKTGFTGMCYEDVDIDVACGYGNIFIIRSWSLIAHQNGSNDYLTVNKTVPPLEQNFTCHDNGTVLDSKHVCLKNISMFEISVYIVTEDNRPPTIAFRTPDEIDQEVTLENDIVIISDDCECDSDNCYSCNRQTGTLGAISMKKYNNLIIITRLEYDVSASPPMVDKEFDVNNLITVIGGVIGPILLLVVGALVTKYIRRDRNREEEQEDTQKIIEFSSRRLEPSSDAGILLNIYTL